MQISKTPITYTLMNLFAIEYVWLYLYNCRKKYSNRQQ